MDRKTKFQNDPAKFFLFQDKLLTESEKCRAKNFSSGVINLKKCTICQKNYDLHLKAPRILIHCGHTLCTECLYLFFKDQRIRCPICERVVKRLRIVEILPLNSIIHKLLIDKLDIKKDPFNLKLRLPSDTVAKLNDIDEADIPLCEEHDERYKHFFCNKDMELFCRACFDEDDFKCNHHIVDLYLLKPELVNFILYKIYRNKINMEEYANGVEME